jgi:hypothetical protein
MKRYLLVGAGIAAALLALGLGPSVVTATQEEPVYGRQLMTPEEITEHRTQIRGLKTAQERQAYRQAHQIRMRDRAKQMGMTLPDQPNPQGKGMGMGRGAGQGQGQGMGPGSGQGQGMGPQRGQGMRGGS